MTAEGQPRFRPDYGHAQLREQHTVEGAREALKGLFDADRPHSVLDVGCGIGTWLKAALDLGASEVLGVDGADLPQAELVVPKELVRHADLNRPYDAGRTFDLVICVETAEHLEPKSADLIIDTLTRHGSRILFSAAVPGQPGMHHVNCQWPGYWQERFNARGYACSDAVRWALWNNEAVEPWYRQNLMLATADPATAGREPLIDPVVHPELLLGPRDHLETCAAIIESGALPFRWYPTALMRAALAKLGRTVRRG